jgi:hypothetical protein
MCTQPQAVKLTKLKMKLLSLKMVIAPIIHKNSCNSFEMCQCDWKDWTKRVMMSVFFGLKFCTNVKNKYEKRILDIYFFLRKKSFNWDNFWTLGTIAHQEKPRKNNNSFPYSPVLTGLVQKLTYCTVECFTDRRSRVRIRGPAFDRSLGVYFCRRLNPSSSSRNPCLNPASWGGESRFRKLITRSWW